MIKIPVMIQMQQGENGATALCMMLGYYKRYVPLRELREVCVFSRNGSSPDQIAAAAAHYGLDASVVNIDPDQLRSQDFPLMIQWKRKQYAIIKSIRQDIVTIIDPARGENKLSMEKLKQLYSGTAIIFSKNENFKPGGHRESLFSLIQGRISHIAATMGVLLVFTLLCLGLNLALMNLERDILDRCIGITDPAVKNRERCCS